MKHKNLFAALALCIFFQTTNAGLQEDFDKAALSENKQVQISGKHFLDAPIRLDARHSGLKIEGSKNAQILGGKQISNWQKEGKFWTAKLDADSVEVLFVNGKRAKVAESEDIYYFHSTYLNKLQTPLTEAFVARAKDVEALEKLSEAELEEVYLDTFTGWYNTKCRLLKIEKNADANMRTVFVINPNKFNFYKFENAPRFKICNAPNLLDKAGEFYFDKSTKILRYLPRADEDIKTSETYYPTLSTIFIIAGKNKDELAENISINEISFKLAAVFADEKKEQFPQAAVNTNALFEIENARNISISNCEIGLCNTYGLWFKGGVTGSVLKDSVFYDCGSGGVKIGLVPHESIVQGKLTENIKVANNIICKYGYYDKAGVGIIILNSGKNTLENNTIFDGYYSGISVGWVWGFAQTLTKEIKVLNNKIFKIGYGRLSDMGGIYTLGDAEGSVISGNEISEVNRHRYGGWGIYNDEGSANWLIEKNYVHNTQDDGYIMHYGRNCKVVNNFFRDGETSQFALGRKGDDYKNSFFFERNLIVYSAPAKLVKDNEQINSATAPIDKNIYWNENADVDFSGIGLEAWQKLGQDKNSKIVNNTKFSEKLLKEFAKETGYEIFKTSAGVKNKMANKLAEILKNYPFQTVERNPIEAPWDLPLDEDLSQQILNETPKHFKPDSNKGNKDIILLEDPDGKRFVRYTDSVCDDRKYLPSAYYNTRITGEEVEIEFDFRVDESNTSFFVQARGLGALVSGPIFWVREGKSDTAKGRLDLPKNKWLHFKGSFKMGADAQKVMSYKVYDAESEIISHTAKYYQGPILRVATIVVASMSNKDGDTFDIANLKAHAKKQN